CRRPPRRCSSLLFSLPPPRPPSSALFPYTTLFRSAPRVWVPPKMTSSILPEPRSCLELVSPSTQRMASEMLDLPEPLGPTTPVIDRKSTRLHSSHVSISYAVFCLKKKKQPITIHLL